MLFYVSWRTAKRNQQFLNHKPFALVAFLSVAGSGILAVNYRLVNFTPFLLLEILLYTSMVMLGALLGAYATNKYKSIQKNNNDSEESINTQKSD